MSLLRTEPPAPVRSLDELFAIAQGLEQEAATRYAELSEQMRVMDMPSVAAVFARLAEEERSHANHVAEWSRSRIGTAPDPAWIRWQPPQTFDEEEARGIGSSRLASAYRALSMAVRNEERAFALWTYIAAQSEEPVVQEAAERMAQEELLHAALLRRERRRAFHAERRDRAGGAAASRRTPIEEAARSEAALATLLAALAGTLAVPQQELRRLAEESAAMAEETVGHLGDVAPSRGDAAQPENPVAEALRLCERTVEAYLAAADAAAEEEAMRRLQRLAERAIARAASLRRMAGQG